ncbi:MBL fold metallo-hydrolase [Ruminococcus albus]|uniref:Glyoxylase, beta-lactamase superfamily II n=1 Tax=Ruminococcus albus TaxID=1264 RepID=A0A1I1PZH7_RUMAL|nr:MBL fold metallo-hydrolase [Ruminococcus albus]SFD15145.1 Glyoxylase, beta-lactamase superfamily II [Ruminococcus albus]
MRVIKLKPLSICETNSYLVISQQNNAVLIDAPYDAPYILEELKANNCTLKQIFLTHGHFDHIGAVADLVEATGCDVYIHPLDEKMLRTGDEMLATLFRSKGYKCYNGDVKLFTENDILRLDELEFDILETPGHTPGSVCYICGDAMFSGDTLFSRSIGRTDLEGGNFQQMKKSLSRIADLGGDLTIYPGHMGTTTLDTERKYNPYLRENAGGGY